MRLCQVIVSALVLALPALSEARMYRSDFSGEVGIVNPNTAAFSVLGNPGGDSPVSGLCADTSGRLFGSRRTSSQVTDLIEINPISGNLIGTIGPIKNGMTNLRITDLACQPSTGVIFGLDSSTPSKLFTIDKTTAAATLIGTTSLDRGGLAFSPDGRLFVVSLSEEFAEISPTTAATIGLLHDTDTCLDGFGIRPNDSQGFATLCGDVDTAILYRIDLSTGALTVVGNMPDWGTDLEFIDTPNPAPSMSQTGLAMLAILLCVTAVVRIRGKRHARC